MVTWGTRRVTGTRTSCSTCRRPRLEPGVPTSPAPRCSSTTARFRRKAYSSCWSATGPTERRRRLRSAQRWASSRQRASSSHFSLGPTARCYVGGLNLIDCVAQYPRPFMVRDNTSGTVTALNNPADCAGLIARCPLRYVLSDDLTRLCADLAYSKGAGTVACADLLRVPAETLWMEWCNAPWTS